MKTFIEVITGCEECKFCTWNKIIEEFRCLHMSPPKIIETYEKQYIRYRFPNEQWGTNYRKIAENGFVISIPDWCLLKDAMIKKDKK